MSLFSAIDLNTMESDDEDEEEEEEGKVERVKETTSLVSSALPFKLCCIVCFVIFTETLGIL